MNRVIVAALQMSCSKDATKNLIKAEKMIRQANENGAKIILLPELVEHQYFCQEKRYEYYKYAVSVQDSEAVKMAIRLADELDVVIPISIYEKEGNELYNSVVCVDAGGEILGTYRKMHIPDDHFYQEKFYFKPGNNGFKVFTTKYGCIGVGVCWDQWFPETARIMALNGAELLLYPTAIGSEPILNVDSCKHWQRCMQGHAAANLVPVIAANRICKESVEPSAENNFQSSSLEFYGSSFMTDETGNILVEATRNQEEILLQEYDLDILKNKRLEWGLFRDRRPEWYKDICK